MPEPVRADKRDELAPIRFIELNPIPEKPGPRTQDIEVARLSQRVSE